MKFATTAFASAALLACSSLAAAADSSAAATSASASAGSASASAGNASASSTKASASSSATAAPAKTGFFDTQTDKQVAAMWSSDMAAYSSVLAQHPDVSSKIAPIMDAFTSGLNEGNALAHLSTLANDVSKLVPNSAGFTKPAIAAVIGAAIACASLF
ncbi:hypothetical protein GQ54DRAFT_298049 [Martensiomyces pterosporus]|nr:hypothetical protein GQ54DRAFT_298049 [Martensiomyces pterosporus]